MCACVTGTHRSTTPLLDHERALKTLDLNVLRGWRETTSTIDLREHLHAPLARLIRRQPGISPPVEALHGADILVGRYAPQLAPVDLLLGSLEDHERFQIGSPHLRLWLTEDDRWLVRALSTDALTAVDGRALTPRDAPRVLPAGSELHIGGVRYRFEPADTPRSAWRALQRTRLASVGDSAALFVKVRGGLTTLGRRLNPANPCVVGRGFPDAGQLGSPRGPWSDYAQPDWDLGGLPDPLRTFIGYRHLRVDHDAHGWSLLPLSRRQRTTLNGRLVDEKTPLESGDQIGLGATLLYFHDRPRRVDS